MLGKSEQLIRGAVQEVLTCGTAQLRLGAPALEVGDFLFKLMGPKGWPLNFRCWLTFGE